MKLFDPQPEPGGIYSVKDLNRYIHDVLGQDPNLQRIWVRGEISNLTNHSSGHKYFTLKDNASQLNCVMFRSQCRNLTFQPEAGMNVVALGDIDVYEVRGTYQLVVSALRPDGIGELYRALEILKKRLSEQGLFDPAHKRSLPRFPERIGVATSPTGAVLHDIINVTRRRFPVDIILAPTIVQGEMAANSIVGSIEMLNRIKVDVIILARGGGSLEDLWPFNSEVVARAIYDSRAPLVSAVGHETDFTIADLAADVRAPTPSAAAELVVPDREEVRERIDANRSRLASSITKALEYHTNHLMHLENRIDIKRFDHLLQHQMQRLDELGMRLMLTVEKDLDREKKLLASCLDRLNSVSPLNTMMRGYSITMSNKKVIKSIHQVKNEDALKIRVTDGEIFCIVTDTKEDII